MASAELTLKRTLTDVLEDELYHLKHKEMDYSYQDPVLNSDGTVEQSQNSALFADVNRYSKNDFNQYSDQEMFNKYGNPSLTTTTSTGIASTTSTDVSTRSSTSTVHSTPVAKTVNLNNVLSVPNPFINNNNNNNNTSFNNNYNASGQREFLPYNIRISNDYMNDTDNFYSMEDESLNFNDSKMYYSLQDNDNNVALNNENAKLIFDNEFKGDDEDDEDDDGNVFEDDQVFFDDIENDLIVPYNFVDTSKSDMNGLHGPMYNTAILDGDVDDDDVDDEPLLVQDSFNERSSGAMDDILFNNQLTESERSKSFSNQNRPSINFALTTNKTTILTPSPSPSKQTFYKSKRVPLTNINNNSSHISNTKENKTKHSVINSLPSYSLISNKKVSVKKSKVKENLTISNKHSDSNEIFTCRLINIITKEPCLAEFSRSYDLTRHQNTIHAKKKIIFRCSECIRMLGNEGYDKTFSRLDALTRHIKSKHETLSVQERQEVTKYAKENIGYVVG
ncbi:hypothetical protein KAFR_0F02260 [Kazachstania africana CBS 2517]|uniref:C2H2-type domain-containing protein n=1 Tax=Kazachstania africana (strain ATCC 22294 / BCRC 22015 / CBS 2517 / CECT 1963 / NBRC 1671 / NRRL Y-8276) TaxID=1071382 RepID=H2AWS3_KAZAF|nr:hypothetical protein KAFR_0F02260 [Kazachstania africana CBS 2517]CCF58823.1 hypothetical protein KAFR_0F02260 [Kazachstania africana CBS 2517]